MAVTSQLRPRARRPRPLALAAAGALTVAGLGIINATPASAATLTATGGSLQWGIKESLLHYHFALHSGTTQGATQGDGATAGSTTRGSTAETYPAFWNFPFVSGSYDSTTNKYTAQYGGFVALTESNPAASTGPGSASPFKYFKVSNPKVVVDLANGTKQLVLDVQKGADSGQAVASGPISEDVDFAVLNLTTTAATAVGGVVTYTNVAAALTAAGAANFGGFYPTGTPVDPVTASLTGLAAGGGTATVPPPNPLANGSSGGSGGSGGTSSGGTSGASGAQTLTANVGGPASLLSISFANTAVSLTPGTATSTFIPFTGNLNAVTLTDTRPAKVAWDVSGQSGNFTNLPNSAQYLGWTPSILSAPGTFGFVPGGQINGALGIQPGPGLGLSKTLASGLSGHALGSTVMGAALDLRMPVGIAAGSYSSLLTITAM